MTLFLIPTFDLPTSQLAFLCAFMCPFYFQISPQPLLYPVSMKHETPSNATKLCLHSSNRMGKLYSYLSHNWGWHQPPNWNLLSKDILACQTKYLLSGTKKGKILTYLPWCYFLVMGKYEVNLMFFKLEILIADISTTFPMPNCRPFW